MSEAGQNTGGAAKSEPSDVVTEGITIRPRDLATVRAIVRVCLPAAAKVFVLARAGWRAARAKGSAARGI